jgi:hypothetical protein
MYVILVAPPGIVSKSTTASIGMNILKETPGIKFGPEVVTWQKLVEDMADAKEMIPLDEENSYLAMSCLTIASSEFGNFLDPNNRDMVDTLVNLWDAQRGTFKKSTKTSGTNEIENAWINVIACTTPAWIAGNFPEYMIGGGFTSRCIFIYAEEKRKLVAYPARNIDPKFEEKKRMLLSDLTTISKLSGAYTLSEEALDWGTEWYAEHHADKHEHLPKDQFGGYLARKQTHIHKLAMVLTAAKGRSMVITKETLMEAEQMVTRTEGKLPKVFERIGLTPEAKVVIYMLDVIEAAVTIPVDALKRRCMGKGAAEKFDIYINALIGAGKVKSEQVKGVFHYSATYKV